MGTELLALLTLSCYSKLPVPLASLFCFPKFFATFSVFSQYSCFSPTSFRHVPQYPEFTHIYHVFFSSSFTYLNTKFNEFIVSH